jgi:hypothetical protein
MSIPYSNPAAVRFSRKKKKKDLYMHLDAKYPLRRSEEARGRGRLQKITT